MVRQQFPIYHGPDLPAHEGMVGEHRRHEWVGHRQPERPVSLLVSGDNRRPLQDLEPLDHPCLLAARSFPTHELNAQFARLQSRAGFNGETARYDPTVGHFRRVQGQVQRQVAIPAGGAQLFGQRPAVQRRRVGTAEHDQFLPAVGCPSSSDICQPPVAGGQPVGSCQNRRRQFPGDTGVLAFDSGRRRIRQPQANRVPLRYPAFQGRFFREHLVNMRGPTGVSGAAPARQHHLWHRVPCRIHPQQFDPRQPEHPQGCHKRNVWGYLDLDIQRVPGVQRA